MKKVYQNPIAVHGDFADPFVLRYNGRYYLYGTNPDVRCWSSDNLLEWKAEGSTILPDTFPELVPFAPEVVYSNGKFYMYTSPSGFGHHVLESELPTGPFRKISGNVQHAIDGSVFIDDDGTWYFYWAGDEGIWGCVMKSPTEFGDPVFTGVTLHGWTEGPFIYKQNDYYYMTYTGNHYLSKGYRINAAWSSHPLIGYQDETYNPVVIHTQGEIVGLGHSSTVLGPDLISHYMIYHNMNEDLSRDLDIDRQLWYGHATQILGPTRLPQLVPDYPDYAFPVFATEELSWQFFEGSWEDTNDFYYSTTEQFIVMSEQRFHASFTAEFHLIIPLNCDRGICGLVFGENRMDLLRLVFDHHTHSLQLWNCQNNDSECLKQVTLPSDYLFEALHCIRVEYSKQRKLSVFIDNRLQLQEDEIHFGFVGVGYFSDNGPIGCGYTAITCSTCEEASEQVALPMDCAFYPVFGSGTFDKQIDGSISIKEGQQVQYQLSVESNAEYLLLITAESKDAFSIDEILIDDLRVGVWTASQGIHSCRVQLSAGRHSMKICSGNEEIVIRRIYCKAVEINHISDKICLPVNAGLYGKKLLPDTSGTDYTVSTQLKSEFIGDDSNAGILVRVTEPSEGGEGADPILGINFFIGYSISFTGSEIVIARHRYDKRVLASCPFEFEINKVYELDVAVSGAEIQVYVNREEGPRLTVTDFEPITYGCAGIWAKNCLFTVENINFIKKEQPDYKLNKCNKQQGETK